MDPAWLSRQLIAEFDTDSSNSLSESELRAIPPLYDARSDYDTDGDGQVSAAEMTERFTKIFDPNRGGLLPARCRVTQNDRPLAGAEVRFVPPKVLAGILPPASGVTEQDGTAGLRLAAEDLPSNVPSPRVVVMRPGIYLVEVTHPSLQIPSHYNSQTTLGKEVFSDVLNGPPLPINLKM